MTGRRVTDRGGSGEVRVAMPAHQIDAMGYNPSGDELPGGDGGSEKIDRALVPNIELCQTLREARERDRVAIEALKRQMQLGPQQTAGD